MTRAPQLLQGLLIGAATGWLSVLIPIHHFNNDELLRYFPGLIFGIAVAWQRGRELRPLSLKQKVLLVGFVCFSISSYMLAVEIAQRLQEFLGYDTPLWIPGFVAGLVGSAKLTAVWQLTKLGHQSWRQWIVVPLIGSLFGLLLHPVFAPVLADSDKAPIFEILFIPWQAAVAAGLLAFAPPKTVPAE